MTERTAKISTGAFLGLNLYWLIKTSARYVLWVDSGELAATCASLGIAHPTGYPLYTLLGRVVCLLHPGNSIEAVVLISTLSGVAAGIFMIEILAKSLKNLSIFKADSALPYLAISASAMLLFYNPISWSLFATNEVYPLHLFFIVTLTLLFLNGRYDDSEKMTRNAALIGFLTGLSFAHHMTTVLMLPAILHFVLSEKAIRLRLLHLLKYALPAFILGLSVYLYMPIRAAQEPMFNWGDPSTIENFMRHISGWQYQSWMFNKSFGVLIASAGDLIAMTVGMFPLILTVPAVIGTIVLIIKDRNAAIFLLLLFAANLLYTSGYTIPEVDTYLLPEVFVYVVFAAIGIIWIVNYIIGLIMPKKQPVVTTIVTALLLLTAGVYMVIENRPIADRHDYRYADIQTHILTDNMDDGAIFLTSNWDFYSPLVYKQHIDGHRPDVTPIDVELLRRSWYFKYLTQADSALYSRIKPNIDRLMPLLRKFERGEPYEVSEIEDAYQSLITAIARTDDRSVYIDISTRFRDLHQFTQIPEGLVYRMLRRSETYTPKSPCKLSLGEPSAELLEFDYSLAKQIKLAETMESEWRSFWDWYKSQPDTAATSSEP